ncbi:alanine--tRNA ligase [Candidatus Poribacteria bacterium]|nr:alanine--tRNA ligase [Candidatus Poribacteria bacterium]
MTGNEIRTSFWEFFKNKGHTLVPSDSLIPAGDVTLLFTNAGMNQFMDVFLGTGSRSYKRAADSQKVIRVSGKHNDLDEVGHDTTHHTFFEMLGNWSFGDYYKREAITYAWELLTEVWGLPKERLWATVFRDDDEAEELWYKVTDIGPGRVLRFDENFWEVGDTGPCGPCSEIHIDLGPDVCDAKNHTCGVEVKGCSRFVEIWNLVFIQYNRDETGALHPLPQKHVDTGLGFERVVAVLQNKKSNYDTDLFTPIIDAIADMSGYKYYGDERGTPHRVVADHTRGLTFAISDGVMPSNEGRGYVIRRILRRAVLYGKRIGMNEPFIYKIVDTVVDLMGEAYPEIIQRQELVKRIIFSEEERFLKTLDRGLEILDNSLSQLKAANKSILPGRQAFELYDTYGFPLDLTQIIATEQGFTVDEAGFNEAMEEQRQRGRASWQTTGGPGEEVYVDVYQEYGATEFLGYGCTAAEAEVLAIVKNGELLSKAIEGNEVDVILNRTPFYGESGGQVGDAGAISNSDVTLQVIDTVKPTPELIVHKCKVITGNLSPNAVVKAEVDTKRRKDIAISHTATHILHNALRTVLGKHVAQSGSLVEPGRLRFDFSHYEAVSKEQLRKVEALINERIRECAPVTTERMSLQGAKDKGAIAFFGEKYGDVVNVVQMGDFSLELCGGTHLKSTGEIGLVKILSESSIAAGVRRIEALTGEAAYQYQQEAEEILSELGSVLKVGGAQRRLLIERVQKLLQDNRDLERQIEQFQREHARSQVGDLVQKAQLVDGVKVISMVLENVDRSELRSIVDDLKNKLGSGVVVLGSVTDSKPSLIAGVTPDLTESKGLKAGDIIKDVAKIVGGSGGGRADLAQAGGREPAKLQEAIDAVAGIVKKHIVT